MGQSMGLARGGQHVCRAELWASLLTGVFFSSGQNKKGIGHLTPQLAGQRTPFLLSGGNVQYFRDNSRVYLAPEAGAYKCHIPMRQSTQ